ncbi:TetR/AcrR family transcriptional regulator [Novosphingobium resinovorum]|nr:hypothetical protein [Novosphingobium resinovorum]
MSAMTPEPLRPRRGRPPSITRERIAAIGIEMGLSDLTFVGVASRLGVSHKALYKHVPSIEALRVLVAEEMFGSWSLPPADEETLEAYLLRFSQSLRDLVRSHPGLAWFLVRQKATTPAMMAKIYAHHEAVSSKYEISLDNARWLLSTIALHCIALADTVFAIVREEGGVPDQSEPSALEIDFELGMRALIIGVMVMLEGRR